MDQILELWHEAALTSLGFFWMALWAFAFGYLISSLIEVLVTRSRMQKVMGEAGPKSIAFGTFFGFISSSCSFAALSTTRALFQKGAGFVPAMAFMLSSTNLVIELGIVISLFLGWQFVVGEYVGGLLLILFAWLFITVFNPKKLIQKARRHLDEQHEDGMQEAADWQQKITSWQGWQDIGRTYVMEWNMVWKDVLIGFTVAGIISTFVPESFFRMLFMGSGGEHGTNPDFFSLLAQTLIGPVVAFFTFIGSMGNIPLAAVLYGHGVSFAGVMAFIFSDLVVLPVLRINSVYYGWKLALYILALLFSGLVVVSLTMHYGLASLDLLLEAASKLSPANRDLFALNFGFILNILFFFVSAAMVWLWRRGKSEADEHDHSESSSLTDYFIRGFTVLSITWLAGGLLAPLVFV